MWTVEEVRAYLPRARGLVEVVRAAVAASPGGRGLPPGSEHAEAALAELEAQGVVIRQVDAGLVDFPSIGPDGEVRLLCWKLDEDDLGWWHRPEDGFAGRRPLEA